MELNFDLKTLLYISTLRVLTHDDHKLDVEETEFLDNIARYMQLAVPERELIDKLYLNRNMSFIQSKFYTFSEREKLVLLKMVLESIISDKKINDKEVYYIEKFLKASDLSYTTQEGLKNKIMELGETSIGVSEFDATNKITSILCLTEIIFADGHVDEQEVKNFEEIFAKIDRKDFSKKDLITGICIYVEMLLIEGNLQNVPSRLRQAIANFLIHGDDSYRALSIISIVLEINIFNDISPAQIKKGLELVQDSFRLSEKEMQSLKSLKQHFQVLNREAYQKASILNAVEVHLELKKSNQVNLHNFKNYMKYFSINGIDEKQKVAFLLLVVEAIFIDGKMRHSEKDMLDEFCNELEISSEARLQVFNHIGKLQS